MGQYYKSVSIEKNESLTPVDYDNGSKLMAHSYIGNSFVNVVEQLIADGGQWFGNRIVWAGDYADPEPNYEQKLYHLPECIKPEPNYEQKLYHLSECIKPEQNTYKYFRFLVNESKKMYVDLDKVKPDEDGWKIHPLPLLTCEGNGRGGGDFWGKDESGIVGSWARDVIRSQTEKPECDYSELIFDISE